MSSTKKLLIVKLYCCVTVRAPLSGEIFFADIKTEAADPGGVGERYARINICCQGKIGDAKQILPCYYNRISNWL